MDSLRNYVVMGALLGSLMLASFAYKVTASVAIPSGNTTSDATLSTNDDDQSQTSSSVDDKSKKKKKAEKGIAEAGCELSPNYPQNIQHWCNQIMYYAEQRNLDPDLVAAVIWQESGGNPSAYSKSGAVGLMQVMPRDGLASSFQCVNGPCFANRPSTDELQDPNFNVEYGTGMLSGLVNKHGNVRDALRSYGPMDVGYYYADKVLSIYQSYSK